MPRPSRRISLLLLLQLFLLLLPPTCRAQTPTATPPPNQFVLSPASPLTAYLSSHPRTHARTKPLHALFNALSTLIDTRARTASPLACNLRAVPWLSPAGALLSSMGLPQLDDSCRTRVDGSTAVMSAELSPRVLADAPVALRHAAQAHAVAGAAFVKRFPAWTGAVDWSQGTHPITDWDIRRRLQTCRVESAVGVRVRGVWHVRAAVTNRPVDAFAPEGARAIVEEYLREDLRSALQLPRLRWGAVADLANGTTLLTLTGGKAGFAAVPQAVDDNPALVEALRLNEGAVDQARDAITPSNVAILALPMVMSLIPVAFVADLSTCATLLYIVLTDLLSCLPFMIKGVELVASGSIERGDVVAYHIGSPRLGLMEVWAANCHGDDHFRLLGYVFIAVALIVTVIGMLLEFIASRVMQVRRRRLRGAKLARGESIGPFGNALLVPSRPDDEDSDDDFAEMFDDDNEHRRNRLIRWVTKSRRQRASPTEVPLFDEPFLEPGDVGRFESGAAEDAGWWSRRRNMRNASAAARDRECNGMEDG